MMNMIKLGEIAKIQYGYAFKSDNFITNEIPVIRIGDITENGLVPDCNCCYPEMFWNEHPECRLQKNAILIAMSGATVGKSCINLSDNKLLLNQRVAAINVNSQNITNYVFYSIKSNSFKKYVEKASIGCAQPNISGYQISNFTIPLRTNEEQEKIARLLDKTTQIIKSYKILIQKYDTLIKSRFIEMFGTDKDFSKWNCCKVEELADVTVGVVIKPTQYYCEKGIPAFRSLNIGEMKVNDSDWVYFNEEGMKKNIKSILKENDVLVVRSGAPGKSCVITKKYEGYNVVDAIIAHPNLEKINPVFLCMFTNMPHGMNQIKAKTGGAAQQHFNVGGYNDLNIILPPLDLQNDFATFVQQIDKSKFEIEKIVKMVYN